MFVNASKSRAAAAVGRERASEIEIFIDALEDSDDASALGKLLQIDCLETRMDTGPQAMPRHEAD